MDENEEEDYQRRPIWPTLMIAGVIVACVALTIVIYRRSMDQPVTLSDNGFSFTKVDQDKPVPIEPMSGRRWEGPGIQSNSSLKMVDPRSDTSIFESVAIGSGTAPLSDTLPRRTDAAPAETAKPEEPPDLTAGEQQVLAEKLGHWDANTGLQLASQPGLIPSVANKLLPYPRIIKVLMNNQLLVNTFMKSSSVQWLCSDRKNFVGFLGDGKSGKGVGPWSGLLMNASRYPGAVDAIMGSNGASTFIHQCGPVMQVAGDQNSMVQVMTNNPQLANVLPTLMQGLSSNSEAQKLYTDVAKIQGALAQIKPQ